MKSPKPLTCPKCGKVVQREFALEAEIVIPKFYHSCGFKGRLHWVRAEGTLTGRANVRKK